MENPVGLKSQFYNMEDGSALTLFTYLPAHQSFPQRVHGGLIATMLDELTLRGYWVLDETMLGVTTSMSVKFRKPGPVRRGARREGDSGARDFEVFRHPHRDYRQGGAGYFAEAEQTI